MYFSELTIQWWAKPAGHDGIKLAPSKNQCYVTLGDPYESFVYDAKKNKKDKEKEKKLVVGGLKKLFHTLVHIACKGADGKTTKQGALNAIGVNFFKAPKKGEPDKIFRAEDFFQLPEDKDNLVKLKYYDPWNTKNEETSKLIAETHGKCAAWVKFFIDVLKVNRIHQKENAKVVSHPKYEKKKKKYKVRLLINKWDFIDQHTLDQDWPYTNIKKQFANRKEVWKPPHKWKFEDVKDEKGVPGQSNPDPQCIFNNHGLAKVNDKIYDPSYGNKYNSLNDFEESAIAGYMIIMVLRKFPESAVGIDINGNGKEDVIKIIDVALIKKNPTGNQLSKVETKTY